MTIWEPGESYENGDRVVFTQREWVPYTGLDWWRALLLGRPRGYWIEGTPQEFRAISEAFSGLGESQIGERD